MHSHQRLKSVNGGAAFGDEALKTNVIRAAEGISFALRFRYFKNDKALSVEVITNGICPSQPIQGTNACIISKLGVPHDNTKKHCFISNLILRIPNLKNMLKIRKYLLILCPVQVTIGLTKPHSYHQGQRQS